MKLRNPFKRQETKSRRDRHKTTVNVRMLTGDYKAVKIMAKSHNMTAIQLLHQFIVQGCSHAIAEDIMKHDERRRLVIALCESTGIKPRNLDKIIPKEESPGETPGAAAH